MERNDPGCLETPSRIGCDDAGFVDFPLKGEKAEWNQRPVSNDNGIYKGWANMGIE
jgi:hypothetical protein